MSALRPGHGRTRCCSARSPSGRPGKPGPAGAPARPPARPSSRSSATSTGGPLTDAGRRLARIYHEADLLVAEALGSDVLEGAEPSVLAGVLSAVVFEPRRARRLARPRRPPPRARGGQAPRRSSRTAWAKRRRRELAWRCEAARRAGRADPGRRGGPPVPRTRQPAPGLATAVASWARGASFATALGVAARDVGELAPGRLRAHGQVGGRPGRSRSRTRRADPASPRPPGRRSTCLLRGVVAGRPAGRPDPSATAASPSFYGGSGMFPYVRRALHRGRGGRPPALRDQPRPAGVRPGQPARGGQGGALRPLLALAQEPAPPLPRRVRAATSTSPATPPSTPPSGWTGPSSSTSGSSSSTATTRWPSSGGVHLPASRRPTC